MPTDEPVESRSDLPEAAPVTANRGVPFRRGHDPRRNLTGRPLDAAGLRKKIRESGDSMVDVLLDIAEGIATEVDDGFDSEGKPRKRKVMPSPADRIRAANALLEHGYGKPRQAVELTGKDGEPLVPPSRTSAEKRALVAAVMAKIAARSGGKEGVASDEGDAD